MIKADLITIVYCRGDHSAIGVTTVRIYFSMDHSAGITAAWILMQGLLHFE